jgi:putative membrane protein
MKKIWLAFAASSLALAACGERTTADNTTATTADGTVVTTDNTGMVTDDPAAVNATPMAGTDANANTGDAQEYIRQAASSDQFEIQSSQLALQQSRNTAVRQFAQQMIDEHRAASRKLQTAATGAALQSPGSDLLPAHRAKLDDLREAKAEDFDEKYIEKQREAHDEAIKLHEAMTRTRNAPAQLASFAREVLPTVQGHARMLEGMKIDD